MTKTTKTGKKNLVFECYVAILFLNIFGNLTVSLVEVGLRKKIHIKRGILQQILVLLP